MATQVKLCQQDIKKSISKKKKKSEEQDEAEKTD